MSSQVLKKFDRTDLEKSTVEVCVQNVFTTANCGTCSIKTRQRLNYMMKTHSSQKYSVAST